jgi:hypothetical protein
MCHVSGLNVTYDRPRNGVVQDTCPEEYGKSQAWNMQGDGPRIWRVRGLEEGRDKCEIMAVLL